MTDAAKVAAGAADAGATEPVSAASLYLRFLWRLRWRKECEGIIGGNALGAAAAVAVVAVVACALSAVSLLTSKNDDAGPLIERYLSHVSPPQYL